MSSEPVAAAPASTQPLSSAEEKKVEAGEAPSTATPAPAVAESVAPVPAPGVDQSKTEAVPVEEKKTEAAPTEEKKADAVPEVKAATPVEEKKPVATALEQLLTDLPAITKEAGHGEIWGVTLKDASHVPTTIVLEKFLRANSKDVGKAKAQLIEALKWRKKMDPVKLLNDFEFDKSKFGDLGYVTVYPKTDTHAKEIVTWNIYGAVKDNKATFGNVEEFIKWRAALMELSVRELDLASATEPIPADGVDPYRMIQVHDYLNTSFLRMDPAIKAASKETIQTFSMAYPELLKEKFFVNVPLLMGWVFAAMKLFLSLETVKKFHPLAYGSSLAGELKGWGSELPEAYGGRGKAVKEGLTVKYAAEKPAPATEAAKEETKE
ncbi:putative phosphatidylinositol transfer protein sfh5 [Cadophora sp. MPI-SDFR-AT-0126]|nr:putative phosphatidylinositol transfer protein sfh5 [Leotiomycetes sp. MPI-SDFR-AT-0126]